MLSCCEICGLERDCVGRYWVDRGGRVHGVCKMCNEKLIFVFGKYERPPAYLFKY